MEEMTVRLDMMDNIRSMVAGGVQRAEIDHGLGARRSTLAKYADTESERQNQTI